MRRLLYSFVPALLLGAACDPDPKDTGEQVEADADADADADTDADADADSDTDADADADADADTDSDADVDTGMPLVEDCEDGADNDGDGLADCEDDDCLEFCLEDCTDGEDNDLDGFIDCDDDECLGDADCPGDYTLTLTTQLEMAAMVWGDMSRWGLTYGAAIGMYGYLDLVGTPDDGARRDFHCRGYFQAMPVNMPYYYYYGADGSEYASGYLAGAGDYTFRWGASVGPYSLYWYGACPVSVLPDAYLGFYKTQPEVTRQDAYGAWAVQYRANPRDFYYYVEHYPHGDVYFSQRYYLKQETPVTWRGQYLLH